MRVSGLPLSATGGHGDLNGYSPYLSFKTFTGVADGIDEIRKVVRMNIRQGADVIKVLATAGVLSEEESVGGPQYSQEELNALVEEAHMWDRRVAAHAHGAEGIKRAIKAGVNSVEHASFIDDEGIRLAKEKGTYLVMDIYNDDYIMSEYKKRGYPDTILEKERKVGRTQRENFRKAWQAGVKMAYGTDSGVYPHGDNGKQFAKMVEWGMTPMQAIESATTWAADLLGLERSRGLGADRALRRSRGRLRRSAGQHQRARAPAVRDEGGSCVSEGWERGEVGGRGQGARVQGAGCRVQGAGTIWPMAPDPYPRITSSNRSLSNASR